MALVRFMRCRRVAYLSFLMAGFFVAKGIEASPDAGWKTLDRFRLDSQRIVLVEQKAADITVRVTQAGETLFEQDGPDGFFGTEVLLFKPGEDYEISIKTTLNGAPLDYRLYDIGDPSLAEIAAADRLQTVLRDWPRSGPLDLVDALPVQHPLYALQGIFQMESALESGDAQTTLDISETPHLVNLPYPYSDHVAMLRVRALWETLQLDIASKESEDLLKRLDSKISALTSPSPALIRQRDELLAMVGGLRVFAGRKIGCEALIHAGGDAIERGLLSAQLYPDYELQGTFVMYESGYRSMVDGRVNDFSPMALLTAEQLLRRAGEKEKLASALNNRAYGELGRGNVDGAQALYREAIELTENGANRRGLAHFKSRLAYTYFITGDYRRARVVLEDSISVFRELRLERKLLHEELQLANIFRASGDYDSAVQLLQKLQQRLDRLSWIEDELRVRTQLAHLYLDTGQLDAAEELLALDWSIEKQLPDEQLPETEISHLLCGKTPDTPREVDVASASRLYFLLEHGIAVARLHNARGNHSAAIRQVASSLSELAEDQLEPVQKLALLQQALVAHYKTGANSAFELQANEAMSLIESMRETMVASDQGPRWNARTSDVQSLVVEHRLERYLSTNDAEHLQSAFWLIQNNRARTLREKRLQSGRQQKLDERAYLFWQVMVEKKRDFLRASLQQTTAVQESEITALEREYLGAKEVWLQSRPQENEVKQPITLGLSDIQALLEPESLALSYYLGSEASYGVWVSHNDAGVFRLPDRASLEITLATALKGLETQSHDSDELAALGGVLLGELDASATTLLLETDGILSLLPFAALSFSDHEPLVDKFAMINVPSLSQYFTASDNQTPFQRLSVAVIADPKSSLSGGIEVPSEYRSWRNGLGRLPYTRVEADAILEVFDEDKSKAFFGENATIKNLMSSDFRSSRILHIASHGFASSTNPHFRGLVLADDLDNSGLLTSDEIEASRFFNDLVVISGCETGRGEMLKGEGLLSVARGFLERGAGATIATRWPVSDRANAEFMALFYSAVAEGLSIPASLQSAQSTLRQMPRYKKPYYWAAFVLEVAAKDSLILAEVSTRPGDSRFSTSQKVLR
jgi:CHAT domain-containing protein